MLDSNALADLIAELIGEHVERATAPLIERIAVLERRPEVLDKDAIADAVAAAVGAIPIPKDGASVTVEMLIPLVREVVSAAVADIPPPAPGKDADPAAVEVIVRSTVAEAVAALPVPKDGQSVTLDDVTPLVTAAVTAAVSDLPPAQPGKDADPAVVEDLVRGLIAEAVAAAPNDLTAIVREAVVAAVAEIPVPKDGDSIDLDQVRQMVASEVAALPVAKDGIGLADALIDRDGALTLTMTDGRVKSLGRVVGLDAVPPPGIKSAKIEHDRLVLCFTDGTEQDLGEVRGKPGFGLNQFDVTQAEDGRTIVLSFTEGDVDHRFELEFPVVIYRDVYSEGSDYARGDAVTWGGSLWIARTETSSKPGEGESWRLAVKRGRDGRDLKAA